MNKKELIESLIEQTNNLSDFDETALDALKKRAVMIISNIYDKSTKGYGATIINIEFNPYFGSDDSREIKEGWDSGKNKMLNLLNTILEEIILFDTPEKVNKIQKSKRKLSNRIFIVHGSDEEMKQAVARILGNLNLEPVILHEQPDKGRTIIEKFSDYSDVSFAVVLLSPDDFAYSKDQASKDAKLRARQNVIFELGFFIGKLGRKSVLVLHKEDKIFEMPSDYSGVLYTPYKKEGNWPLRLSKELQAYGYDIDLNKLH